MLPELSFSPRTLGSSITRRMSLGPKFSFVWLGMLSKINRQGYFFGYVPYIIE